MYTTNTSTREFALKAAAAAERAMERHACCKSQFKFKCFSCGETIHRGDKITRCNRAATGMTLRYRGADNQNGLTMAETTFYQANTGNNMWVHIGCIPCYWDSLPPTSNEYSRPSLSPICTDWGVKVYGEWEEWSNNDEAWSIIDHGLPPPDVPYYCKVKGYPKEKFMRDRIIHNVKRFQAIWRGYLYKKAYPLALAQRRATIWREFLAWCGSLPHDQFRSFPLFCEVKGIHTVYNSIQLGQYAAAAAAEENNKQEEVLTTVPVVMPTSTLPPSAMKEEDEEDEEEEEENSSIDSLVTTSNSAKKWWHGLNIGDHCEVLFNRGEPMEAIYSGKITKIQGWIGNNPHIWVKYHYDEEVRRYHWKKFKLLKNETKQHKKKLGIDAKLIGRLNTARITQLIHNVTTMEPLREDWNYHYPDGTSV